MSGVLNTLLGSGGVAVSLNNNSVSDIQGSPATAAGSITVNRDGTVTFVGNASSAGFDWATPKTSSVGDAYQVKMTLDSGDAPVSGTIGSFLALTSNRTWEWLVSTGPGTKIASCTLEIANASGVVLATCTVSVDVESV